MYFSKTMLNILDKGPYSRKTMSWFTDSSKEALARRWPLSNFNFEVRGGLMSKLPGFMIYPGDWLRDSISGCSLAAQGLWLRMMFIGHDGDRRGYLSQDGMAIHPESIARRCGCTLAQYMTLLDELTTAGVLSRTPDGTIFSRRMVRDEEERQKNAIRQKRHYEKEKPNGKPNANLTATSRPFSSSVSSSVSIKEKLNTIAPTKVTFDWSSSSFVNLDESLRLKLKDRFPAVELETELKKMEAWFMGNPKNRKSNYLRFIVNWLTKAQDSARVQRGGQDAVVYRRSAAVS